MTKYFTTTQLKELTESLKMSSIKRYASWLKVLQPTGLDIQDLEKEKDKYINQALKVKDNTQTFATLIKMLNLFSGKKSVIEEYEKAYNKIRYKPKVNANRPATQQEQERMISFDEILNFRDEYIAKWNQFRDPQPTRANLQLALKKLVLVLYTELPPLRGQSYFETSFDKKLSKNYIEFGEPTKLHIVEGKTMKGKEPLIINLNKNVVNAIADVRKMSNGSDWLIPQISNPENHMKSDGFTTFLNRIFGKKISTTTLRNIVVSHRLDQGASKEEMDNLAETMGHTPATQRSIYGKNSKRMHKELGDLPEVKLLKDNNELLKEQNQLLREQLKEITDRLKYVEKMVNKMIHT